MQPAAVARIPGHRVERRPPRAVAQVDRVDPLESRPEDRRGELFETAVRREATVVERDGRLRRDPRRGTDEVGARDRRIPTRRAVVDDHGSPRSVCPAKVISQGLIDGDQGRRRPDPASLAVGKECLEVARPRGIRSGLDEDLMAVVDQDPAVPTPGPSGRLEPAEIVAVVRVGIGGGGGGALRPAEDDPAPAEEPVHVRPAGRHRSTTGPRMERRPDQDPRDADQCGRQQTGQLDQTRWRTLQR